MPRLPNPAALTTRSSNGYASFVPSIRKLVFEYCDIWPSSAPLRTFIHNLVEDLARRNPHVEFVVKQRPSREPVIRGFYRESFDCVPRRSHSKFNVNSPAVNNRDKVIGLKGFEPTQIAQKVQLLLDSSGNKIVPLKRKTVVSTTESARGIWSGLHTPEPYKI